MPVVVGVLAETAAKETRVAVVPEIAAKLTRPWCPRVDGTRAPGRLRISRTPPTRMSNSATPPRFLSSADVLLKVQPPTLAEVAALKKGAVLVGFMQAYARPELVRTLHDTGHHQLRDGTRAAHLARAVHGCFVIAGSVAGYKAALIAANSLERFLPMLTTAAGTIRPARCW